MSKPSNKKMLVMMKELTKSTDHAAYLIHKITGEDLDMLRGKSKAELMQRIGTLIAEMEMEDHELNWQNDKSTEVDTSKDSKAQKKEAKNIVNTDKGKKNLFSSKNPIYEFLKVSAAIRSRKAMVENLGGDSLSTNAMNAQPVSMNNPSIAYTPSVNNAIGRFTNEIPISPSNDNSKIYR